MIPQVLRAATPLVPLSRTRPPSPRARASPQNCSGYSQPPSCAALKARTDELAGAKRLVAAGPADQARDAAHAVFPRAPAAAALSPVAALPRPQPCAPPPQPSPRLARPPSARCGPPSRRCSLASPLPWATRTRARCAWTRRGRWRCATSATATLCLRASPSKMSSPCSTSAPGSGRRRPPCPRPPPPALSSLRPPCLSLPRCVGPASALPTPCASPPRLTPLLFQAVWSDATAARLGMGRLLGSIDSWLVAAANKEPDVSAARKKRLLLRPLLRPLPRARHGMGMGLRRSLAPCPRRAP